MTGIFQARRQQRKLNFLITQTELYAHFMAKKMTGESEQRQDEILHQLDESKPQGHVAVSGGVLTDSACDDYGKQFQMCIGFFPTCILYICL